MGRDVAVKFASEQFGDRFETEARAIAALNQSNICTIQDVGPNYLVMELIEGPTLADRIAASPIGLDEALGIARQIADAVKAGEYQDSAGVDLLEKICGLSVFAEEQAEG